MDSTLQPNAIGYKDDIPCRIGVVPLWLFSTKRHASICSSIHVSNRCEKAENEFVFSYFAKFRKVSQSFAKFR